MLPYWRQLVVPLVAMLAASLPGIPMRVPSLLQTANETITKDRDNNKRRG